MESEKKIWIEYGRIVKKKDIESKRYKESKIKEIKYNRGKSQEKYRKNEYR